MCVTSYFSVIYLMPYIPWEKIVTQQKNKDFFSTRKYQKWALFLQQYKRVNMVTNIFAINPVYKIP